MKRIGLFFFLVLGVVPGALLFSQDASQTGGGPLVEIGGSGTSVLQYFAAALAVGISCIAGGIAVGKIGAAAMVAMGENAELSGKALPYAGLAEGICLWGFLVALLILVL